jgi:hypothetical protein
MTGRPDLLAPRRRDSGATYGLALGSAAAMVLVALLLPLTLGHAARARTLVLGSGALAAPPAELATVSPPSDVPGAARTASDQGVTKDQVTLGVAIVTLGSVANNGANTGGYDVAEQKRIFQSFVKGLNARGGVGGRSIKAEYVTFNILDSSSQTAACKELTETRKAFAVVSILGIYGDPILCFTNDHKVPYLANDGAVSDYYRRADGLLFTLQPSTLRTQANAAWELHRRGELTGGGKIGFVYENGYLLPEEKVVAAYIEQLTGRELEQAVVSSNGAEIGTALGQSRSAAVQFCSAGVDKVFIALNSLYAGQLVDAWDRTTCDPPKYFTSDFFFQMAGDSFVGDLPESYFTRALGVTSTIVGGPKSGEQTRAGDQHCLDVSSRNGGPRYTPQQDGVAGVVAACGLVGTFEQGLARAGTNPTRRSFADALARLGTFSNPGFSTSTFRPGKLDGPDEVRAVKADPSCRCWKLLGDGMFSPARFR